MESGPPSSSQMDHPVARPPSSAAGPHCPGCGIPIVWSGNPTRPFCSLRCKLIDLGVWLDEAYRVAGDGESAHRDARPGEP